MFQSIKDQASSSLSGAASSASSMASSMKESASNKLNQAKGLGDGKVGEVVGSIPGAIKDILSSEGGSSLISKKLIEIGRPSVYHNSIDPNHRISNFFKHRMAIIDLLPCHYKMSYNCPSPEEKEKGITGIAPTVEYDDQMENFYKHCNHYGLPPGHFLRVFTTEDTNASDQISNSLGSNFFQEQINAQSQRFRQLRQVVDAFDQTGRKKTSNALNEMMGKGADALKEYVSEYDTDSGIGGTLINAATSAAELGLNVIGKGHRISLPKIWNESSYTPNLSVNLKLVSPYGHPSAIKEFIIKPLIYLLILASPETSDGISYGRPTFVTVKAYGLGYTPIGIISNLTLRRGGNDLSFSIYKQPLSINISFDVEYASTGFAHHTGEDPKMLEANMFSTADQFESHTDIGDYLAKVPTVGHIIKSLKPRELSTSNFLHQTVMQPIRNTKPGGSSGNFISEGTRSPIMGGGMSLTSMLPQAHSELKSLANSAISSVGNMAKSAISSKVGSLFS